VLARTEPAGENRRQGLTQFIVDNTADGIERTPVTVVGGRRHFNDVRFTDVFVPTTWSWAGSARAGRT